MANPEENTPWAITVDETPEPWEDYGYLYCIVMGTEENVQKYVDELKDANPEWMITYRSPYVIKELKVL